MPKFGVLHDKTIGSHTEDEWQTLVRKYGWRCFYCGSPMSAWRNSDGRILQIRNRNVERPWEMSGKVLAFVSAGDVPPENVLTKDHLVPRFHNGEKVDFIWNIRPADLRCNRLKGTKTVGQFLEERKGLIFRWLNSLPADDWRVLEWGHWQTDEEIDAAIAGRFSTAVHYGAHEPTGVFALASGVGSAVALDVEKLRGKAFAFASPSLPSVVSLEERVNEPGLLKKLQAERDGGASWAWRNPA